jgi:hypothetical protein
MKILGMRLLKRAERVGNEPEVPLAQNLGLVDFFKLIFKEAGEDLLAAFAARHESSHDKATVPCLRSFHTVSLRSSVYTRNSTSASSGSWSAGELSQLC